MPTTVQVQTEDYTDDGSHPVKFLFLHTPATFQIIDSRVAEQIDGDGIRYEFDLVFFGNDWHEQFIGLFVFDGRCVWHEDKSISHGWWEFSGTMIPATVPEWGEVKHG